jgi:spore coat polysaccharide biosynthesis predicted glycosyltransferase SpsG/GNAT superfamily N-acetyltransferase
MRVLLRCDGGGSLGVGHVIRSLALAEAAVAAGHRVLVAGRFEGSFLQGQLEAAPVEVVPFLASPADGETDQLIELVRRVRPDVLHVDSYPASERIRELLADEGPILSNVEDGRFGRRPADVVVDPTLCAELSVRPDDGSGWLLRGSRYTPVRRRVIDARRTAAELRTAAEPEQGPVARSVLVVMGGTDPVGLAPAAVGVLARTGLALAVTVIAQGENAGRARSAAEGSLLSLDILAPAEDLATLMSTQDLVVSAAGTSIWELCCIGVPAAVVWAVDNQRQGYDQVVAAGVAIGLGGPGLGADESADERAVDLLKTALTDARVRAELVTAGRRIVDGQGAWRVVRTWELARRQSQRRPPGLSPSDATPLVARPATPGDSRLLWQWRNDPATRAGSRSSAEVPWEDHSRWLTSTLDRTDRLLLVVEDPAGTAGPVGTVRWDLLPEPAAGPAGGHEWEVSITVAPAWRGKSLARPLLRAGELALSGMAHSGGPGLPAYPVSAFLAVVHRDNGPSVRLFEGSGYVPDLPADPAGFMRFRKIARVP